MKLLLLLVLVSVALLSLLSPVSADNYAVLVAGSNTYANYRHQADMCHAYKLLRRNGIPEANILSFFFDDLAFNNENPFPGRLFNRPTNNVTRGVDVYVGCGGSIDANVFRGADVIPSVFIAAITGNVSGVPKGKAVLQSTQKDDVFINFIGQPRPPTPHATERRRLHPPAVLDAVRSRLLLPVASPQTTAGRARSTSLVSSTTSTSSYTPHHPCPSHSLPLSLTLLPRCPLCFLCSGFIPFQATVLNAGLRLMSEKRMFNKLVFYLEACEAGSIFDKQLPANIEVYAVTASNVDESSWGTYCPGEEKENGGAYVDGVDIGSCLGDLFSVNWMEDSDAMGPKESLETQFTTVRNQTTLSHVMQYGNTNYTHLPTGNFIASMSTRLQKAQVVHEAREASLAAAGAVPARDIALHVLTTRYKRAAAGSVAKREAMRQLAAEVSMRARVDEVFERFAEAAVKSAGLGSEEAADLFPMPATPIIHDACMNQVEDVWRGRCGGWNEYSTQYGAVIINACRMNNDGPTLAKAMGQACAL